MSTFPQELFEPRLKRCVWCNEFKMMPFGSHSMCGCTIFNGTITTEESAMKLEDVLYAFRSGKKIRMKNWDEGQYIIQDGDNFGIYINRAGIHYKCDCSDFFPLKSVLNDDWEIVKEKVKYYLALICSGNSGTYFISRGRYKSYEDACKFFNVGLTDGYVIRLLTEVPELIEERDE